mmetsp:Transcript_18519/g.40978  ORF Transcript_18519/g.40978 Transcript_18519/m.40978 type:complete len:349 (-) Transcript_18519:1221-2267(-)
MSKVNTIQKGLPTLEQSMYLLDSRTGWMRSVAQVCRLIFTRQTKTSVSGDGWYCRQFGAMVQGILAWQSSIGTKPGGGQQIQASLTSSTSGDSTLPRRACRLPPRPWVFRSCSVQNTVESPLRARPKYDTFGSSRTRRMDTAPSESPHRVPEARPIIFPHRLGLRLPRSSREAARTPRFAQPPAPIDARKSLVYSWPAAGCCWPKKGSLMLTVPVRLEYFLIFGAQFRERFSNVRQHTSASPGKSASGSSMALALTRCVPRASFIIWANSRRARVSTVGCSSGGGSNSPSSTSPSTRQDNIPDGGGGGICCSSIVWAAVMAISTAEVRDIAPTSTDIRPPSWMYLVRL